MAKPKQNKITNTKQSRMHFDSQELANKEEQIRKLTESVLDFVPASNIATQAVYFEELWNKQMNMNDYRMDNSRRARLKALGQVYKQQRELRTSQVSLSFLRQRLSSGLNMQKLSPSP